MNSPCHDGPRKIIRLLVACGLIANPCNVPARAGDDSRTLSATIDRLIAERWAEVGVVPARPADDAEFLRRVSLDLNGRIPTGGEARAFLDDPRADKRGRLVDRLLDGPAYITHLTDVELRLLIPEVETDPAVQQLAPALEAWLREQITANAGGDRIARAILTAPATQGRPGPLPSGMAASTPGPSPLPYFLAKDVRSENLAASSARLFLGLRLECAQCHDHPFATWTRDQFWGYAAFFAGLERGEVDDGTVGSIREQADRRELSIPGTDRVVQAALLDGGPPRFRPSESPRVALADWMTSPENPYFARAAANRIWARLFGVGLVDPVDDMGDDNPPSHPKLLEALARSFAEHGFDRKFLTRAIVLSRPYQLTSDGSGTGSGPSPGEEDAALFARMRVRGLTAEQLYDSLVQAIGLPHEELGPGRFSAGVDSPRGEFLEKFARLDEGAAESETTILQALALMNGRLVTGATALDRGATLVAVAEAPFLDPVGRVEALFLATLSRRPRPEESARLVAYLSRGGATGDRREALSDVFWALLNSPEFLLNH